MKKIDIGGNTYTSSTPSYTKQSVNIGENTYTSGSFMDNYFPSSTSSLSSGGLGYVNADHTPSILFAGNISPEIDLIPREYNNQQKLEHIGRSMICVGASVAFGGFLGGAVFPVIGAGPGAAFGGAIGGFFCPGKDNNEHRF